jgi:hypothetical protein
VRSKLLLAAWLVLASQVAHVVVSIFSQPGEEEVKSNEGVVGLPLGLLAIIVNIVCIVGLRRDRDWAPNLTVLNSGAVAIGFILYHGIPFHSFATNPYWGVASAIDWLAVALCVGAGFWAVAIGWPKRVAVAVE